MWRIFQRMDYVSFITRKLYVNIRIPLLMALLTHTSKPKCMLGKCSSTPAPTTISFYINCIISILIHSLAVVLFVYSLAAVPLSLIQITLALFRYFLSLFLRLHFLFCPECGNVFKLQSNKSMTFEMHCISQF